MKPNPPNHDLFDAKSALTSIFLALLVASPLASAQAGSDPGPLTDDLPDLHIPAAIPDLNAPIEIEDVTPWALVAFHQGDPVTLKPIELLGPDFDPLDAWGTVQDARRKAPSQKDLVRLATVLTEDPADPDPQKADDAADELQGEAFELQVTDWPGGLAVSKMLLRVTAASLPAAREFRVDINPFNADGVSFYDVPLLTSAKYTLFLDSKPYVLNLFRETRIEDEPQDVLGVPVAAGCTPATHWSQGWDGYDRDWNGKPEGDGTVDAVFSKSNIDLGKGGWRYHWNYRDGCWSGSEQDVYASFGFGWTGENLFEPWDKEHTFFGAQYFGSSSYECYNRGGYRGKECVGHRITLDQVKFFYQQPSEVAVTFDDADFDGFASSSCPVKDKIEELPEHVQEAIALAAVAYFWLGLSTYVADKACHHKGEEARKGYKGAPGLGARMLDWGASDERLWKVSGDVDAQYGGNPGTESRQFTMRLEAGVHFRAWIQSCLTHCNYVDKSGAHHYEVSPHAKLLPEFPRV